MGIKKLLSDRSQVIQQTKFTYSLLEKVWKKKKQKGRSKPTSFTIPKQKKERAKKSSFKFYSDFNKKNIRDETNMKTEIFI